jgi:hypothetical protein
MRLGGSPDMGAEEKIAERHGFPSCDAAAKPAVVSLPRPFGLVSPKPRVETPHGRRNPAPTLTHRVRFVERGIGLVG